ncbi:ATP-binding cassette, subfamily B [Lachnospiraceae bacterium XBB1006]|nr:ATP-binding cassette, subfamily B [Lachnospiraceae bacterium XBB1006]
MWKLRERLNCIREIGQYTKKELWIYGLVHMVQGFTSYLYIEILNKLYAMIWAKTFGMKLWFVFLGLVGCILISDILNGLVNMAFEKAQTGIEKGFMTTYILRAKNLEPEQFLQKEVLDAQQNMKDALEGVIYFYMQAISLFFDHVPYYLFVVIFLIRIDVRIAVVMLITFIPAVLTWKLRRRKNYDISQKVGEKRRQMDAYEEYNTTLPALYETRYYSMQERFLERFSKAMQEFKKLKTGYFRTVFGVELLADGLHLLGIVIILGFIVYMVKLHQINGAQVATVLTVLLSIYDSMGRVMKNCVGVLYDYASKVTVVAEFLKLTEKYCFVDDATDKRSFEEEKLQEIALHKVSYGYPDADDFAIKDISLKISAGEVIAVVGENGSGKTTLSRLLGGFLPVKEGSLCVNGESVRESEKREYRKKVSAVFQDFQRYPLTLKENICFEDAEDMAEEAFDRIRSAVQLSGKNPDVVLSKEFGGEEYSGGQWQRVAIARGQYKNSDLLIFDEPTSAIDPLEEVRIMKLLVELCKGKMAILVTHRIGAASLADRIVVMKDGCLVESGSHEELLQKKGEYFRMYETQKQWYV